MLAYFVKNTVIILIPDKSLDFTILQFKHNVIAFLTLSSIMSTRVLLIPKIFLSHMRRSSQLLSLSVRGPSLYVRM